ncbi:GNAT family N-acetyltransferase [Amycolatopsis thermophila]|uniref:GNAT superfamily N-acetyltransferase n=1 Tax=Amycolatopsis thermophila TaxID=206084 RepID=A0ABU0ELY7_9PSEU|nr:GNAT family N-acetyltransferase [Amycolatopsis thermophila]MDQ0376030.1 GNAT superfamily N-acetyltransferase [Amycolatopsis thermophila]
MALTWVKEESPRWDAAKRAAFGDRPEVFGLEPRDGQLLADEWWAARDGDEVVGWGRLDSAWGDAEILVVVRPERRGRGVGAFVLEHLEREAAREGLNYVYNSVRTTEPGDAAGWLRRHGFTENPPGQLRKRVRAGVSR